MIVTDFAVNRRITVFVLLGLIVIVGAFSFKNVPREAMPEIAMSIVTVATVYPGVSPGDMETLITIPIERQLTSLPDVKKITSTSVEGVSAITIEFNPTVDINEALQKVRDKVNLAKSDMPDEAEDSMIREVNVSESPVMLVSLTGDLGIVALSDLAEEFEDKIETVAGVLEVDVVGDIEREIQVIVDPGRIAEFGITLNSLVNLLRVENVNTPGGAMDIGEAKYLMRVPGEFSSPEELQSLVVKRGEMGIVYLRDIAVIKDGFKDITTLSRVGGQPAVTLQIKKRSGENIIGVSERVKALIAIEAPRLPSGVEVLVTMDQSKEIKDRVDELANNIISGLVLVLIILFFFMGFSNAFFVALAIPFSFMITFGVFMMMGITLNMIVLFALTLSLGMLVDNGIVVVENIYRHAEAGLSRVEAAKKGASEVALPVIASTATTIAAFGPLFFWPGMMGQMMQFLPKTITIILLASLFIGLVVNPALASVFMRAKPRKTTASGEVKRNWIIRAYSSLLKLALRWRMATISLAITSLVVIIAVYAADFRVIFLPETEPFSADINVRAAEGTDLETTDAIVRQIEKALEPYADHLTFIVANVGVASSSGQSPMSRGNSSASSHLGGVTLHFPPVGEYELLPTAILEAIRPELEEIPGAEIRMTKQMHSPPSGPAVNIELTGDEFDQLAIAAQDIRRTIRDVPNLVDLRDNYDRGKPEIRVEVDRRKAWMMDLNTQLIGMTVRAAVDGTKAGEFRDGEDEYDVMVQFPDEYRMDLSNIESMSIMNQKGVPIPFSTVAKIEEGAGLGTIKHIDRKRTLTISADADGRDGPEVLKDVRTLLSDLSLPPGYSFNYTGEFEDMGDTQNFLFLAFFIGMFLMAMILITQFNSLIQPMIILSSVVLSLAGVFLGLLIFDMPFGAFMTMLGCISLAGIVVNNAIVLMDFINQERKLGTPVNEAIIKAGETRFRPVMLTAVTTVLGLIPMAIGVSFDFLDTWRWVLGGPSSQYWGSMAVAICFGLSFATLLTLLVVPVLYSLSVSFTPGAARKETLVAADALDDATAQMVAK